MDTDVIEDYACPRPFKEFQKMILELMDYSLTRPELSLDKWVDAKGSEKEMLDKIDEILRNTPTCNTPMCIAGNAPLVHPDLIRYALTPMYSADVHGIIPVSADGVFDEVDIIYAYAGFTRKDDVQEVIASGPQNLNLTMLTQIFGSNNACVFGADPDNPEDAAHLSDKDLVRKRYAVVEESTSYRELIYFIDKARRDDVF